MRILNSQSYDTVQGRLGEPYTIQRASNSNPRGVLQTIHHHSHHSTILPNHQSAEHDDRRPTNLLFFLVSCLCIPSPWAGGR